MPDRDPRTDPREGDELRERGGDRRIVVDRVTLRDCDLNTVYYRVLDGSGGLLKMRRIPLWRWEAIAVQECEAPHD